MEVIEYISVHRESDFSVKTTMFCGVGPENNISGILNSVFILFCSLNACVETTKLLQLPFLHLIQCNKGIHLRNSETALYIVLQPPVLHVQWNLNVIKCNFVIYCIATVVLC